MTLFTDASSLIGYGAFWNGHWLQQDQCKPYLGPMARRKRVLFHCDNQTIVHFRMSGLSLLPQLKMHFFPIFMSQLPLRTGISLADALSRF